MSKLSKRLLSWMLLVAMLCTLLPTAVFADDSATTSGDDDFYKIVHVDAGRKYFSPANINLIIDNAAAAGFNQVELYLSDNQGFRFALDNMTVTTDYGTYDLTPALGDGYSDGSKYPDYSGKYLTQSEMTEIIAYAETKGIEIVPCINVPGHMGAILEEFSDFRYTSGNSTSQSSIDLANEQAVAFALALTEKYVGYFAGQGLKYYNVGADEYANDLSSMGFEGMGTDLYTKFVEFLNDAADIVIAAGMTPRAFNDGFYYKDYSISVEPNKAYEVCYWSSGWSGYDVAAASTIAAKGHKMINTHGDYYWVLGNSSWQCSASKASGFDYTVFQGSTISDPDGAMFCIWCDVGNADGTDYGSGVVADTADVIAAFGATLPATETSEPEVEEPVAIPNAPTTITVGNSVVLSVDEAATWTSSNEAVVTIKEAQLQDVEGASVEIKAVGAGTATISAVTESGTTYASGVTVVAEDTDATIKDTVASNGGTAASYELDTDGLDSGSEYLIVYAASSATDGVALVNNDGTTGSLAVTISGNNATPSSDASTALWTYAQETVQIGPSSSTGYVLKNGNYYIAPSDRGVLSMQQNQASVTTSYSGGAYTISRKDRNTTYYVYYNDGWGIQKSSGTSLRFYKYTESTETYTVTPSLQESRIKDLTVSIDGYTDESWSAYQSALTTAQSKLAEVKAASYSTEAAANTALNELIAAVDALETAKNNLKKAVAITVNYQFNGTTVKTETMNVAENATSVTLPAMFTVNGQIYGVEDTELALNLAYITTYNVAVTEVEEDLTDVDPLTVEFWITNVQVTANNGTEMEISAEAAYGESGVLISTLVPAKSDSETYAYWKTTRLDSAHKQTTGSGVNQTLSGTDFAYIRYYNGSWAYSADGKTWTNVANADQIVAYYMQVTEVTDEVTTHVVDWGELYGTSYNDSDYVLVDYAVKYESGERVPDAFPISGVTQKFHCSSDDTNISYGNVVYDSTTGVYYRNLWAIRAVETSEYEVYMITLTPTADSATSYLDSGANSESTGQSNFYAGTEKVVWVDDEANLGKFEDESLHYTSISGDVTYTVGGEPTISQLEIYNKHGMLITYYVRAKATEDALTVHYIDATEGANNLEFYTYNIAVQDGTVFQTGIALNTDESNSDLLNGDVINYYGRTQTVSADLSTLSQVGAQYLYSDYTCIKVVRSDDGKHVYLYYNFNPTVHLVVDFGLPVNITAADLSDKLKNATVTDMLFSGSSYTTYGQLTDNGTTVTYTPDEILTGTDFFTLVVQTQSSVEGILDTAASQIAFRVYVHPANNVMYEETFVTAGDGWTRTGTANTATQAVSSSSDVYGYDAAYATNDDSFSNGTAMHAIVKTGQQPQASFSFIGDGLEVISECSINTGVLYVRVTDGYAYEVDGVTKYKNKVYIVDTYFNGTLSDNTSKDVTVGTAYQIPVVHDLTLPYGSHDVTIIGYALENSGATVQSLEDNVDVILAQMGDEDAVVEVISMNNVLGNEDAGDSLYGLSDMENGLNVYIDGIRVYNTLASEPAAYVENDAAFYNMYDVVKNWNASAVFVEKNINQNFTYDASVGYANEAYKTTGPTNEVYLKANQGMAFKVTPNGSAAVEVQVSAKAITGSPVLAWGETPTTSDIATISTKTELYYTVSTISVDGEEYVYIYNNALSNVAVLSVVDMKIINGTIATVSEDELSSIAAFASEMEVWKNPFKDVTATKWYFEELKHLNIHGIINGMTNTQFGPSVTTDRAMIVTTLWRMEGQPEADAEAPFSDVSADKYYTEAVAWAAENDIVNGYPDGTFKPKQAITRQEIVAILYRYAAYKGCDMSGAADLTQFTDVNTVNSYAKEPMAWAVANGIIKGYDENGVMTLKPRNNTTRAELAVMLYRIINYCARN